VGSGGLTNEYLASYGGSVAIQEEHVLDASTVLRAMEWLPRFWKWLDTLQVIETLDVGSGEGMKSQYILETLLAVHRPERAVLRLVDSDDRQLHSARMRVANWPVPNLDLQTVHVDLDRLLRSWTTFDIDPAYVTAFHVAYYLEQRDDVIPALGSLARRHSGYTFIVTEGPGQLQDLKWYMNANHGYGTPVSRDMVVRSMTAQGLEVLPPIQIPHHWRVDLDELPEVMFERDLEFILANNFNCPPVSDEHRYAAGTWVQRNAHRDENGGAYLDGPDDLIIVRSSPRLRRR
jgi:hypothetical protein